MLENIRQIGIFMIIAQTVMHFAAGKQYEKYMKIIAGAIVLLQFISPFLSNAGEITAKWQAEAARMMQQIEAQDIADGQLSQGADLAQAAVIRQLEEEIRSRLNAVISERGGRVTEVAIELTAGEQVIGERGEMRREEVSLERVRVGVSGLAAECVQADDDGNQRLQPAAEAQTGIYIGEIRVIAGADEETDAPDGTVGDEDVSADREMQELRRLFAQTLGIAEERVEVTGLGEW